VYNIIFQLIGWLVSLVPDIKHKIHTLLVVLTDKMCKKVSASTYKWDVECLNTIGVKCIFSPFKISVIVSIFCSRKVGEDLAKERDVIVKFQTNCSFNTKSSSSLVFSKSISHGTNNNVW